MNRWLLPFLLAVLLGCSGGWMTPPSQSGGEDSSARTAEAWLNARAHGAWVRPQEGWTGLAELPSDELGRLLAATPFASFDPTLAFAFRRLAKLDPACALHLAATRGDAVGVAIRTSFDVLAPRGSRQLEARLLEADPDARVALGLSWIDRLLGARQPAAALEFAMRADLLEHRLESIFREFRARSLPLALERAEQLPRGLWRRLALSGALLHAADPLESARALLALRDLPEREQWLHSLLREGIKTDTRATLELIARVQPAHLPPKLLSQALDWCPAPQLPIVRSWWQAQPESERLNYRIALLQFEARIDPARTFETLVRSNEVGDDRILQSLAVTLATRDPAVLRSWAIRLPPGPQRLALVAAWMRAPDQSRLSMPDRLNLLLEVPAATAQEWMEAAGPLRNWSRQDRSGAQEWIRTRAPLSRCQQFEDFAWGRRPGKYR